MTDPRGPFNLANGRFEFEGEDVMSDILEKLDRAWEEDHKTNLMHYCDLAAQEIRKLRNEANDAHAEVVRTQDDLGRLLHTAEAEVERLRALPQTPQVTDEQLAISGLNKDWNRLRSVLARVYDFMIKDVVSGDDHLWTDEYGDIYRDVSDALAIPHPQRGGKC